MAEEYHHNKSHEERCEEPVMVEDVDVKERGMFDFLGGKKELEKPQDDVKGGVCGEEQVILASEFEEKVRVKSENPESELESREEHHDNKHHVGLLEKLRRSDSSSSSSSDEEECEEAEREERKKKKKEQKKKLQEEKKKREDEEDVTVPVEKCDVEEPVPTPEEKKGFLGKIKEKLPGQHKKVEEVPPPPPPQAVECYATTEVPPPPCQEGGDQAKEKKGIFEKIKEKLPGFHHKDEEDKEKEKDRC